MPTKNNRNAAIRIALFRLLRAIRE